VWKKIALFPALEFPTRKAKVQCALQSYFNAARNFFIFVICACNRCSVAVATDYCCYWLRVLRFRCHHLQLRISPGVSFQTGSVPRVHTPLHPWFRLKPYTGTKYCSGSSQAKHFLNLSNVTQCKRRGDALPMHYTPGYYSTTFQNVCRWNNLINSGLGNGWILAYN